MAGRGLHRESKIGREYKDYPWVRSDRILPRANAQSTGLCIARCGAPPCSHLRPSNDKKALSLS